VAVTRSDRPVVDHRPRAEHEQLVRQTIERYGTGAAVPTHAERARTIVGAAKTATLSTIAADPAGHPFGSFVSYATDDTGRPILCLSDLAEHSKNLEHDTRASLLVAQIPQRPQLDADPLASGRVTVVGTLRRLDDTGEITDVRARYLAAHEQAYYVDFDDFSFFVLEPEAVRFVGGFGMMSWIDVPDYATAEPDPLVADATRIVEHMNEDHPDAVLQYARFLGGIEDTIGAEIIEVDRYGFDVLATTPGAERLVRISFAVDCVDAKTVREEMIRLVGAARAARPSPS
jgi:heme iron utilization protein